MRNKQAFAVFSTLLITTLMIVSIASIKPVKAQGDINIEILDSIGGTTNPGPGMHAFPEGQQYTITATPNEGFVFDHWIVTGDLSPHSIGEYPSEVLIVNENPLVGDCGFGFTYQFQPVFAPASAASMPSIPVTYVIVIGVVAVVVGALAAIGAYMVGKRKR